ncbi:centromere protein H (CENP-H)-domain-containing protein [Xylariales sp. AK1849]|nr:centromere protein H (CENP-H)-domain-containing protein [Xylariales sp. AK1849]
MLDSDPESAGGTEPNPLLLANDEKRILELYDRLQKLQLEIALITAQKEYLPTDSQSEDILEAQNALLESRARYVLRTDVVESVMIANPILQAVHSGTNASPIERDLLPVLSARDLTSTTLAHQTTALRQTLGTLTETSSQTLRLSRHNVDLASQVLALAEESDKHKAALIEDPGQAEEITRLVKEVKTSRQRWRVMKATASAIVAGSGVDWARDEELSKMVLDDDEDGV